MTKEQERDELHRAIWQIANDLRGAVDGWDFKSYVLGFLFYRKDISYFATLVDNTAIAANEYNLSVTSYVEQEDTRERIDITALNAERVEMVERQNQLRAELDVIIADWEGNSL